MRALRTPMLLASLLVLTWTASAPAADEPTYKRQQDVIYGRKFGTALTLDVFRPTGKANGAAVIYVVSGGWFSAHRAINPIFVTPFTRRGYTVFAVVHGSQPRYVIPEILQDMHRAVRFIRSHARDYGIDPERIGITGGSAGGHLSLMQGTAGLKGNPNAKDPIDKASSRVQAVACFFPPTDFLNYGKKDSYAFSLDGVLANYRTAIDVREFDKKTKRLERITDKKKVLAIARQVSPITHVSADDPPTLILHGDADKLVPIQQAEIMINRLKEVGVPCKLLVKPGAAHGWKGLDKDLEKFADWFDQHLLKKAPRKDACKDSRTHTRARVNHAAEIVLPSSSARRRICTMTSAYLFGSSACGPSERAFSGQLCTSICTPSAPAAMAA